MPEFSLGLLADWATTLNSRLTLDRGRVTDDEIYVLKNRSALAAILGAVARTEHHKEAARGLVRKAFAAAVFQLGEEEALSLWRQVSKKRRAGKHGSRKPDQAQQMLCIYDELVAADSGGVRRIPRFMAQYLNTNHPGEYGSSADAIEKQIRRLIRKRRQENLTMFGLAAAGKAILSPKPLAGDAPDDAEYLDRQAPPLPAEDN